jgi:arylsulfatase A
MTGKYNHRNYKRFGTFPEDDVERTFGNLMKKASYTTCFAGKWQLGNASPHAMGFDASMQCDSWGGYWTPGNIRVNGKKLPTAEPKYRPDIVCDFVLDFIEANEDRPFFVYWPMFLTHHPEQPSPDYPDKELIERCKQGKVEVDEYVFPDMVTYMDKLIGRAVAKLDELGIRDNTIIIFLGDNGTCGGHPDIVLNGKPHPSGGKGSMKDLGTRVPLIVNWKGVTSGKRCSDMVDLSDYYPTLADIAGEQIASDAGIDGRSFFPQVKGEPGNPRQWAFTLFDRNDTVAWRAALKSGKTPGRGTDQGSFWARTTRWKLFGDGSLFDMEKDPFEQHPLSADTDDAERAAIRKKLEAVFEQLDISQDDMVTFEEYKKAVEAGKFQR